MGSRGFVTRRLVQSRQGSKAELAVGDGGPPCPAPRQTLTRAMSAVAERPRAPAGPDGAPTGSTAPRRKILVRKTKRSKGSVVGEGSLDGRSADGESTRHPTPQQRIDFGLVGALETAAPLVRPTAPPAPRTPPEPPREAAVAPRGPRPEGAAGARNGPCSATSVRRAPPAIRWFSPLLTRRTDPWRAGENEIVDRPAATARGPDRASPAPRATRPLTSSLPPNPVPAPFRSRVRGDAPREDRGGEGETPPARIFAPAPRRSSRACARKRASRTAPSTTIIPARIANSPRRAKSTPPSPRRSARRAGRNARTPFVDERRGARGVGTPRQDGRRGARARVGQVGGAARALGGSQTRARASFRQAPGRPRDGAPRRTPPQDGDFFPPRHGGARARTRGRRRVGVENEPPEQLDAIRRRRQRLQRAVLFPRRARVRRPGARASRGEPRGWRVVLVGARSLRARVGTHGGAAATTASKAAQSPPRRTRRRGCRHARGGRGGHGEPRGGARAQTHHVRRSRGADCERFRGDVGGYSETSARTIAPRRRRVARRRRRRRRRARLRASPPSDRTASSGRSESTRRAWRGG